MCGLFILFGTMRFGIGVYTPLLTISTLAGFVTTLSNRKAGLTIILFVSIAWLLRYFEHASYLLFYDRQNAGRWLIITIPILLAASLFILTFKARQLILGKSFSLKFVFLSVLVFVSVGLLSFVRKPNTNEFNCWYHFDNTKNDFKISFAITPDHIFEATSNSNELKDFILKNGIRDEFREGIYCPETKVKVITRFKKIVSVEILGFHNTTTNVYATLRNPIEIDINKISGDKSILEPDFTLGD